MTLKINMAYRLLFTLSFIFLCNSIFGNDSNSVLDNESNFKSKELIDKGITNQLGFLINYNKENSQNWYVYIVGEDQLDFNLFADPTYVENQLDLNDIGLSNTPLDILKLNKKLIEVNKLLLSQELPIIYYGVANRTKAIPTPFFPNEGKFNASTTDSNNDLLRFYFHENFSFNQKSKSIEEAYNSVSTFLYEKESKQESLLAKTLAKASENGAVALSSYYLALIKDAKKSEGGKVKLLWWSFNDHAHSDTYFNENSIDMNVIKKHIESLSNAGVDKNYVRINAWYNYLTGSDVPESEFLSDMLKDYLNNPKCANLSIVEADQLKSDFIAKITDENKDDIIAFLEQLCPAIVLEVDYQYIIKAIKLIASERINEKGEITVLALMYGIKEKDYGSFFNDLKAEENALLNQLLVQMDDASLNPFDKNHYSSFIGQLLYMGYQNNGEYLKKERIALLEAILNYKYEIDDLNKQSIEEVLAKVLSFNLSPDESAFENYLVKDDYKMMLEFVSLLTKEKTSLFENQNEKDEDIRMVGDAWGKFFAERNNEEVYIKLLKIAFSNESGGFAFDIKRKNKVAKLAFRMLAHLPQQANELYKYFTLQDENEIPANLKKIIKRSSGINHELYGSIFYDALTKILDSERDIKTRLQIVKWAIEDDDFFNDVHENMVVNIFKNIENNEDKVEVYNFLTYKDGERSTGEKNYEYFSKITDQGILSGTNEQVEFINFYIGLIKEGIGNVEDRIGIIKQVIEKGDDWSMLWFSNDSEDIISTLFNDLTRGDAEYIIKELKGGGSYKLFKEIWSTLQSVNLPATFDKDNSQLSSFAINVTKLLQLSNQETGWSASLYEKYLDRNHDYLNSDPSQLQQIDGNYLPMVRSNFFHFTDGDNRHILETEIDTETSGKVKIDLTIGGNKIVDKSYDPFEYIFIEFIEETTVNDQVKFSKGDIIGVPAFYLAWMDGSIDAQQRGVAGIVVMDGIVVVVGTIVIVGSGGTLTPLVMATIAEVVFAGIHIPMAIYKKEAEETFGKDFVMAMEIGYIITGLATMPQAIIELPKNLVTLSTVTKSGVKKVVDYTKGGVLATGTKVEKITINVQEFLTALPNILKQLKNNPQAKEQLFQKISSIESQMRTKMAGFGNNVPEEFRKAYNQILELTKTFYLDKMPAALASIINNLPSDKLQGSIIDKLLIYKFEGKIILGIDAQGILNHVKKYNETEDYTTVVGNFKAEVKLQSGEQYEATIEVAKNDLGVPVFRLSGTEKLIEDLVSSVEDIYKALLKSDLEGSKNLVLLLNDKPNLIETWKKLANFPDIRRDLKVLETYADIKRIGSYTDQIKPTRISELTKTHPTPKLGKELEFSSLKESFKNQGYDVSEPIKVVELPDGVKLLMDGNHRLKGMEDLDQEVVPAHVMTFQYAKENEFIVEAIATNIEIAKLSGNYLGSFEPIKGSALKAIKDDAIKFMDQYFPGWSTKVGITGDMTGLKEVPIASLTSTIRSNGKTGKNSIKEYADKINKGGYDLNTIEPVKVVELPDGTKVIADVESHYRAAAMSQATGVDVPTQYITYDELLKLSPSSKRQRELGELYYILKIGQQTGDYKSNWLPDMSWQGEKELFHDIPNKVDDFLKQEFSNISRPIPLRSIDELLNYVDYPRQKKLDLKEELLSSIERARDFGNNPDLLEAWDRLYDISLSKEFQQKMENIYAMDAYIKKAAKSNNTINAESFNRFVKNKLDSDAYVKSILFSDNLYGGIKVSPEWLNDIKLVTAEVTSPQYSGSGKFGSFEIRLNEGKIERYMVDDSGNGSWENLNASTLDDVNFVITTDGKLRIGHGHYNLSGEATSVISPGKMQIVDGKVTEISNFSGHYLPGNQNLHDVEKVFKKLGVTSDDFKIFENPNAAKIKAPIKSTGIKYKFEEEGYVYEPAIDIEPDGRKEIFHFIKNKDGKVFDCGESILSPDGILENVVFVPKKLRKKEISKAIYNNTITDEVKSIKTEYPSEGALTDNYTAFKIEYSNTNDKVKAVLATPEGRVLGKDWIPTEITFNDDEVLLVWVKK